MERLLSPGTTNPFFLFLRETPCSPWLRAEALNEVRSYEARLGEACAERGAHLTIIKPAPKSANTIAIS